MKKYFAKPGISAMVSFDVDTQEIDAVDYMRTHIDWMYTIPEDGVLATEDGDKNVKKGDIVVKFYPTQGYKQNNPIVIKSKEWKANIAAENDYNNKMREKFELNEDNPCCTDCEKCNDAA